MIGVCCEVAWQLITLKMVRGARFGLRQDVTGPMMKRLLLFLSSFSHGGTINLNCIKSYRIKLCVKNHFKNRTVKSLRRKNLLLAHIRNVKSKYDSLCTMFPYKKSFAANSLGLEKYS